MIKKIYNNIRSSILGLVLLVSGQSMAAIKLPALFGDHMVLQQKTKVHIWGWASPGEEISLTVPWKTKNIHTKADGLGNWKMIVETPVAGGPYNIKINGENSVELKDVLIGEVWICSGQSNMTFPLKYSDSAKEAIAKADYPTIRYFGVKRQFGQRPLNDFKGSVWEETTPKTAASFSAVAYYFARKIQEEVKVPVGVVLSGWSGTPAEAWTPKAVLEKDDSLQYYLQRWKEIPQRVGADSVRYHLAMAEWEKNKNSSNASNKPDEPRSYYYYTKPWCEPGALFNGMVNPAIPFTVKGVLWYQGESNVSEADNYEHLFTALINSWRQRWSECGQKQLPFYFVQIAPFGYSNLDAAARLRQAQYNVMKKEDLTGMAVTTDVGDMSNLHCTHKKEVGERLALIALARSYGKNVIYAGPECKAALKINDKIRLRFDQPVFTTGQQQAQGFEVGYKSTDGDSIRFVPAQSVIKGNEVTVWNSSIKDPLMVRYAWLKADDANLVNRTGLPAYPFRQKILVRKFPDK